MSSRTIKPDFTDEPGLGDKLAKPCHLPRPFGHQLRMEAQPNLNSRRAANNSLGSAPRQRGGCDRQHMASPADSLGQHRSGIGVQIEVAMQIDHSTPETSSSLLASSMPRPTVFVNGVGSSSSAKLIAPEAQWSIPSARTRKHAIARERTSSKSL